jgi:2-keto-3-deoxy-L-rhamnonate aldolase RhmA
MELPRNEFKRSLAAGKPQIGIWSSLASNIGAEILADSGFDWILLDCEHSPNDVQSLLQQLQAVQGSAASAVVRPPWNDLVMIKRVLDLGPQSILVPYVQTVEEAQRAVLATRYPPKGLRGVSGGSRSSRYGRVRDYLKKADDEICLLVQVETRESLERLDQIAAVEGVDGVFIGPSDLSASFGRIGEFGHPEVQAAIEDAAKRIRKAGKAPGILTTNEEEARRYLDWGFLFVAVGVDTGLLARNADALAKRFKG